MHKSLENKLIDYEVVPYTPYRTLCPPSLISIGRFRPARIIHTPADYGVFHLRKNVPLVTTFHGYMLDNHVQPYGSIIQNIHRRTDLYWFTKAAAATSTGITAVSRFIAELTKRDLKIEKDIRVIYNGVDETMFTPSRNRKNRSGLIKVLFSGNLKSCKGAQWLLPIAEKLNHNIIIQYTSGLLPQKKLPTHRRLECLGSVPHEEMPALYQKADLLLFPTVREGFGLAVAEAMACGLPVVASDCSSLPELIDHGKGGFLCPIGNIESFAASIHQLAENGPLRMEMGLYNRIKIEKNFRLHNMVIAYQRYFEEILDTHR
ncbi:MAG: glycosyltransferase family 4 protein [Methylosarcina sp.]